VVPPVRAQFGDQVFATVIPLSVRIREAPVLGQSLLEYAPSHPVGRGLPECWRRR